MSINPKRITAACMLSVIACAALAVPTYDVSCLDCSRDTPLMPLGINLSGVVVASDGCVNPDANYPPYAPPLDCFDGQGYVIDHGTITMTPVFPGTPNSQAMAINDSNVVAGMASHPKLHNVLAYAWDGQDTVKLGARWFAPATKSSAAHLGSTTGTISSASPRSTGSRSHRSSTGTA